MDWVFWIAFSMIIIINRYHNRNIKELGINIIKSSIELLNEMKEKENKE